MMHLNDVELVDALDGLLSATRAGHVEECPECHQRLSSLREALLVARPAHGGDVPEPSPLFWEHFSRRVHEAVQAVEPLAPSPWVRARMIGWVAAAAVILSVSAVLWNQNRQPYNGVSEKVPVVEQATMTAEAVSTDIEEDDDWALVRIVAEDLAWEDAHDAGISARPGSAERVALEMSAAERQEFARLIEDEMKRTGA